MVVLGGFIPENKKLSKISVCEKLNKFNNLKPNKSLKMSQNKMKRSVNLPQSEESGVFLNKNNVKY